MKKTELRQLIREELLKEVKIYVQRFYGKEEGSWDSWEVASFKAPGDAIIAMNALQKTADKTSKGKLKYSLKDPKMSNSTGREKYSR